MKFLFHILHTFQNGPATIPPSPKLGFIRVHHSLGKSSTNTPICSLSLAAYRVQSHPPPPNSIVLCSFKVHSSYLICPSPSLLSSPGTLVNFTRYSPPCWWFSTLPDYHVITQIIPTSPHIHLGQSPWESLGPGTAAGNSHELTGSWNQERVFRPEDQWEAEWMTNSGGATGWDRRQAPELVILNMKLKNRSRSDSNGGMLPKQQLTS